MMAGLEQVLVIGSLGLTVVALRLFFDLRAAWLRWRFGRRPPLDLANGAGAGRWLRVRLKDGPIYTGLSQPVYMDETGARAAGLPQPLTRFVRFARSDGGQVWIDSQASRVIEVEPMRKGEADVAS
ncbi:MAG: hypothetical protein NZ524_01590 [Thiobacillaceae bacterium]|nr:hypothetical protein [Thiobacillaceae bacterium]MCX7672260.1 hypothetical protein [Thiobacillaceae bacterium]MDW8322952.1 hypothetical protein [Burkholderiales bacterium]